MIKPTVFIVDQTLEIDTSTYGFPTWFTEHWTSAMSLTGQRSRSNANTTLSWRNASVIALTGSLPVFESTFK
jgi:hypothetical protein